MFEGGVWRTIGGQHIFIKDGESLSSAMKRSGKFKPKKMTKAKEENEKFDEELEGKPDRPENKYRVKSQALLYDEEERPDTAMIPTKEGMIRYFNWRARKENDSYLKENAEKLAEDYIKYREELKRKAKK